MDVFAAGLWVLRLAFVVAIYLVLLVLVRALWRDLRAAVWDTATPLGRLVVLDSPRGRPEEGLSIPLDAVTTLGRDVNNTVVIDDAAVAPEHALLTFRGRAWYIEDRVAGAATRLNGQPIAGAAALGFGDELELGAVRLRLERSAGDGGPG